MSAPRKNAFTLIELLVVISIIALLVSILLPALNQARDLARQLVCSTHLKSVYLGISLYANDYKGLIPNTLNKSVEQSYGSGTQVQCTYFTYLAYDDQYRKPNVADGYMPWNLAQINEAGLIETPEIFYCPSLGAKDTNFAFDTYITGVEKWGDFPTLSNGTVDNRVRVGYTYWRYWRNRIDKQDTIAGQGYSDYPFCYDVIFTLNGVSHLNSADHTPKGLNVLWGGGHVSFVNFNEDMLDEDIWGMGSPAVLPMYKHREILFRVMGWEPQDAKKRLTDMGWFSNF